MKYYTTAISILAIGQSPSPYREMHNWCERVVGPQSSSTWDMQTRGQLGHPEYLFCFEYRFINAKHKLLFDLAWSHLGIYDSVKLCKEAELVQHG